MGIGLGRGDGALHRVRVHKEGVGTVTPADFANLCGLAVDGWLFGAIVGITTQLIAKGTGRQ